MVKASLQEEGEELPHYNNDQQHWSISLFAKAWNHLLHNKGALLYNSAAFSLKILLLFRRKLLAKKKTIKQFHNF